MILRVHASYPALILGRDLLEHATAGQAAFKIYPPILAQSINTSDHLVRCLYGLTRIAQAVCRTLLLPKQQFSSVQFSSVPPVRVAKKEAEKIDRWLFPQPFFLPEYKAV